MPAVAVTQPVASLVAEARPCAAHLSAVVAALLLAARRVYAGPHYPADVVAGLLL